MIEAKTLQNFLKNTGFYAGVVDGVFGPISYSAARIMLKANGIAATNWDNARTYIGIQQLFLNLTLKAGLVIDGFAGVKTNTAIYAYTSSLLRPPVTTLWPRQADVPRYFGEVGKNQAVAKCPYTLYGDYERKIRVNSFSVHTKVKRSVERVLARTLSHYGLEKIRRYNLDIFSGCFVVRRIRGGVGWSMHSWGIAIDWDAAHNEMYDDHTEAAFAKPRYEAFLDFWEDEGWTSLGRARNRDWMHFQAARL